MILLLDTSTPDCSLKLVENDTVLVDDTWHADRELAEKIFTYLHKKMSSVGKDWSDISGIGMFQGPGSFTGLRIGATVVNTLSHTQHIPVVGVSGDDWQRHALDRLENNEDDKIILPDYGRPARITSPRK